MGTRELRNREERERMIQDVLKRCEGQVMARTKCITLASAILVLHDKFGYGKKRLDKFCGEVADTFDSLNERYINYKDIKDVLLNEIGIDMDAVEAYLAEKYSRKE